MMLLLELQQFDLFKRVVPHAKRIMDNKEFAEINKLYEEFNSAVLASIDPSIPEKEEKPVVDSTKGKKFDSMAKHSLKQELISKVRPIQEDDELEDEDV